MKKRRVENSSGSYIFKQLACPQTKIAYRRCVWFIYKETYQRGKDGFVMPGLRFDLLTRNIDFVYANDVVVKISVLVQDLIAS